MARAAVSINAPLTQFQSMLIGNQAKQRIILLPTKTIYRFESEWGRFAP
jgi:hypothetical protein